MSAQQSFDSWRHRRVVHCPCACARCQLKKKPERKIAGDDEQSAGDDAHPRQRLIQATRPVQRGGLVLGASDGCVTSVVSVMAWTSPSVGWSRPHYPTRGGVGIS